MQETERAADSVLALVDRIRQGTFDADQFWRTIRDMSDYDLTRLGYLLREQQSASEDEAAFIDTT